MMTVFNMDDGSTELENVDILATREDILRPFEMPSLQLLSVAESEIASRLQVHHRHSASTHG
ncbi:MAG: hypothetical protein NT086_21420 [Proteobacteria bacterium]|nr:hypothetical protein [Pseudomonadota bacterium]